MNPLRIVSGFVPFIVFSLLSTLVGAAYAATAGLLVAIIVIAATARGGIKLPPAFQAASLLVTAVLAVTGGPPLDAFLVKYGPGITGTLLGLFMIATAATMPFTAQMAHDSVPREVWHSPQFLEVNRRLSTAWGLAVVVVGLCHLAGAEIGTEGAALVLRLVINWVPPVIALWRAAAYTRHTVAETQNEMQERTAS